MKRHWHPTTRRNFLKATLSAGLVLGSPQLRRSLSAASDSVRLAVIGLGGTTTPGGVGGRGHQLIARLLEIPGAKITALCDPDQEHLDREVQPFNLFSAVEKMGKARLSQ